MVDNICPFIGMQDDRETVMQFPAKGNTCYKASPPGPVRLEYQKSTCLTAGHAACPVFLAAQPVALPAGIAEPDAERAARRLPVVPGVLSRALSRLPLPARFMLPALAAALLILVLAVSTIASALRPAEEAIPRTGSGGFPTPREEGPSIVDLLLTRTVTPAETSGLRESCPLPDGWTTYIVQPTDSVFLLSRLYNVDMWQFRAVNCLGSDEFIRQGEVVYVPVRGTPTLLPTVFITQPVWVAPFPTATSAPPSEPTSPPAPTETAPPAPTNTPPGNSNPVPTETPAPGSSTITLEGNNLVRTVTCAGNPVVVIGNGNRYTLLGTCASLTINGNNNDIDVENSTTVIDNGNNNTVR